MNRRSFLRTTAAIGAFSIVHPGLAAEAAKEEGEQLLKGATARIEKFRKGNVTISLAGNNVAGLSGAKLSLRQQKHAFLFGCNAFGVDRCGTQELEDAYRRQFASLFNFATLGFYWASFEPQRGSPNYAYIDKVIDWTEQQRITCKGHPLVWDHPAGSPGWLPTYPQELGRLSEDRVRAILSRYKGRIDIWDVVNEATHLPDKVNKTTMAQWALGLGSVPYVQNHLKVAREAGPGARLIVNDYRIGADYLAILQQVSSQSKSLFDIVGIQSHMHDGLWPHTRTWEVCERYARLGLPLHFTETTLVSGPRKGPGENWGETTPELEEKQAKAAEQFYTLLFSHPAVQALTWWDFSDLRAWQRAAAGFVRTDMSPKPIYTAVQNLIKKQWWSNLTIPQTNTSQWTTQVFYGDYLASVEMPGGRKVEKQLRVAPGAVNEFTIKV